MNLVLELLKISKNHPWGIEEVRILHITLMQANLFSLYYRAQVLTEIIERKEALQFLKEVIDYSLKTYAEVEQFNDLESLQEEQDNNREEWEGVNWIRYMVNNGKFVRRIDKCKAHEALKELEDRELSCIVACGGDWTYFKKMNENFVLTRTQTLMEGYAFCDNCFHDMRLVDEIEHPSKEFFENLWPMS